jgi:hypothetical protein
MPKTKTFHGSEIGNISMRNENVHDLVMIICDKLSELLNFPDDPCKCIEGNVKELDVLLGCILDKVNANEDELSELRKVVV